jgi:hypothetical protein
MDNLVSIYHGGTLERDRYGYVEFVDMQSVPVLFDEKPSFSELVARAWKEVHCHEDDDIAVEGVLHLGSPPNLLRKMIPIGSAYQWEKYVRSAMKRQFQSLDVVVQRVLVDPIPHGFSRRQWHNRLTLTLQPLLWKRRLHLRFPMPNLLAMRSMSLWQL